MIADDEERICKLIELLVPWKELELEFCAKAFNGIQALELVTKVKPDILITDIRMPGCDGLHLIAQAKRLQPDLEIIIISGFAHFEYARTSMQYGVTDYLLKPINKQQLSEALQRCTDRCRQRRSIQQLMQNQGDVDRLRAGLIRDLNDQQARAFSREQLARDYHYSSEQGDLLQAVLVKICSSQSPAPQTMEMIQNRSVEIFRRELEKSCHDVLMGAQNENIYGVISFSPGMKQNIRRAVRDARRDIYAQRELFGGVEIAVALGSPEAAEGLQASFEHAKKAVLERLVEGNGHILENIPQSSGILSQVILDRYSRSIYHAVDTLSQEAAAAALTQACSSVLEVPNVRGREIMNLARNAADIFTTALIGDNRDAMLRDFYGQCARCGSAAELRRELQNFQIRMMNRVIQQRETEESRPIRMAKQYIQEHYADAITLEEVAESAGFSSSYFSTFFKKEAGSGFNQYLTKVRMDHTKNLLRSTDHPVAEICRMVGYSDLKHFSRIFHKETGMTPGEYRKIYQ